MYSLQTQPEKPVASEIEAEIRLYIRIYLAQRAWFIAQAVAELIDGLLRHPEFDGTVEQRCGFMRLARFWRCVAWLDRCSQVTQMHDEMSEEE